MPFADVNEPERFEGMLVRFPQPLVISEYFNYDRFGEIALGLPLPGEPRPFTGTVAVSPNLLWLFKKEDYSALRQRPPDDRAGVFFIYRLPEPETPPRP